MQSTRKKKKKTLSVVDPLHLSVRTETTERPAGASPVGWQSLSSAWIAPAAGRAPRRSTRSAPRDGGGPAQWCPSPRRRGLAQRRRGRAVPVAPDQQGLRLAAPTMAGRSRLWTPWSKSRATRQTRPACAWTQPLRGGCAAARAARARATAGRSGAADAPAAAIAAAAARGDADPRPWRRPRRRRKRGWAFGCVGGDAARRGGGGTAPRRVHSASRMVDRFPPLLPLLGRPSEWGGAGASP